MLASLIVALDTSFKARAEIAVDTARVLVGYEARLEALLERARKIATNNGGAET